jgi:catechol 2,3-dioxygenase-like lactoylglutathione lyase family enzyme
MISRPAGRLCADPLPRGLRPEPVPRVLSVGVRAKVVLERDPVVMKLANSWLILNAGGGPTDDKPTVTLTTPGDPDRASAFLNIRVADIGAVYAEWPARGAEFLTEPKDRGSEIRAYIRDPDGHLIEVGQTTGLRSPPERCDFGRCHKAPGMTRRFRGERGAAWRPVGGKVVHSPRSYRPQVTANSSPSVTSALQGARPWTGRNASVVGRRQAVQWRATLTALLRTWALS